MITTIELSALWGAISPQRGNSIGRRIDPAHPLDFFATYDEQNNMQIMLLSPQFPDLPSSSQQILVRGNKRTDGEYAICLSLVNNALRELFISLCWDIMDCTSHTVSRQAGVDTAIRRFRMWQTMLAEQQNRRLSDEEVKGLVGELLVLKHICAPKHGIEAGVSGWIGPLNADRDFELSSIWYEVKATSLSRDRVTISSFEQLDTDVPGYLVICRIERTSHENSEAFTLRSLIADIDTQIGCNGYTATVFHNRLSIVGFNPDDERVDQPYSFHAMDLYFVADQFPRIRRSAITTAISDGKYSLNIVALEPWRSETEENDAEL